MKKFLKSILTLSLVLAICFAFAGCKIVRAEGTWVCNKMTGTLSYTQEKADLLQLGGNMTIVLGEDGSMTIKGNIPTHNPDSVDESGTWELDGTTITLKGENTRTIEWNNNKLIYTIEQPVAPGSDEITATRTFVLEFVPEAKD